MFEAEPWNCDEAQRVPLAETLLGCQAILDGTCDDVIEEAFYMAGTIEQVVERSRAMRLSG